MPGASPSPARPGQLGRELVRAFARAGDEVLGALAGRPSTSPTPELGADRCLATRRGGQRRRLDRCGRLRAGPGARDARSTAARPGPVAGAAAQVDALVVQVSTNEVFDGTLPTAPYAEDDCAEPDQPVRRVEAGRRASRGRRGGPSPDRAHGVAVRSGRAQLRDEDSRRGAGGGRARRSGAGLSTTSGATRPGRPPWPAPSSRPSAFRTASGRRSSTWPVSRRRRGTAGPRASSVCARTFPHRDRCRGRPSSAPRRSRRAPCSRRARPTASDCLASTGPPPSTATSSHSEAAP